MERYEKLAGRLEMQFGARRRGIAYLAMVNFPLRPQRKVRCSDRCARAPSVRPGSLAIHLLPPSEGVGAVCAIDRLFHVPTVTQSGPGQRPTLIAARSGPLENGCAHSRPGSPMRYFGPRAAAQGAKMAKAATAACQPCREHDARFRRLNSCARVLHRHRARSVAGLP